MGCLLALLLVAGGGEPRRSPDRPLGLNLAGIADWSTELVFNDAMKASRPWVSQAEGKPWGQGGPLDLDRLGNVKSLKPGQSAEALLFVEQDGHYPTGDYVCRWEGTGELVFGGAARVKEKAGNRAVVAVEPARGQVSVRLTKTDPADPVRGIRFFLPGTEATADAEPFHPSLVARLKGFRVIRFMDWGHTNNNPTVSWADRTTPAHATQAGRAGVAAEHMLQLVAATGCDPWLCVPHLADDGYVTELAKLVRDKLPAGRRVYVEYSNETWNGQFAQAKHCQKKGLELGLSKNAYEAQLRYSSQRSVEIFKLFAAAFGDPNRVVRVIAAQSANPWTGKTEVEWQEAYKQADAVAVAPYFGNRLGDPKKADATSRLSVEQVLEECRKDIAANAKPLREYAELARKRNLKLLAYEGGQHLAGYGGAENTEALTKLFHAANRHPGMGELYAADLKQWFDLGGDVFAVFSSVGRYSKWGSWGLLERWDQPEDSGPKMRAVRAAQR
jgi:hypothetical protein